MQTKESVQEILRAGTALAEMKVVGGVPTFIIPDGYKVHSLESHLSHPLRKRGAVILTAIASLIQYVNMHKGDGTIILADVGSNGATFKAIIDHHSKNDANFAEHIATYQCKHSEEWDKWFAKDDKPMRQVDFAEFLEENKDTVIKPEAAGLLEMISSLAATRNVDFVEATNLFNGNSQFTYDETVKLHANAPGTTSRKELKLPSVLECALAPFENNEKRFPFKARLKYRLTGPKLEFFFQTIDKRYIVETAINDLIKKIKDETGICVMLGSGK